MPQKTDELKTKMLWNLISKVADILPNWELIFNNIVGKQAGSRYPRQDIITDARETLQNIYRTYGKVVLAEVLSFTDETGFSVSYAAATSFVGKALSEQKHELLKRTVDYCARYPEMFNFSNFPSLFDGIEKFGEEDLYHGMDLAPKPGMQSSQCAKERFYGRSDGSWTDQKRDYALLAAYYGYPRMRALYDRFRSEGLTDKVVLEFLERIIPNAYLKETEARNEAQVLSAIQLVKTAGLSPKEFAETTYWMIRERKGSRQEILQILMLTKEYNRSGLFLWFNDDKLLSYWRGISKRHVVLKAFRTGDINTFFFEGMAIQGLGIVYELGSGEQRELILRELNARMYLDAVAYTLEMLEPKYNKIFLTSKQRYAIAKLARNSLLTASILREVPPTATIQKLVIEVLGDDAVAQLRRIKKSQRSIYAMAMLRTWGPEELERLLCCAGRHARSTLIQAVVKYDPTVTAKALRSIQSQNRSTMFLLPEIEKLTFCQSTAMSPSHWEDDITSVKDESIELLLYMQLPYQIRLAVAGLVREYRHAYHIMLVRIATGHAYR